MLCKYDIAYNTEEVFDEEYYHTYQLLQRQSDLQTGQPVTINLPDSVEPSTGWGGVNRTEVGVIIGFSGDLVRVRFLSNRSWVGHSDSLKVLPRNDVLKKGDIVREISNWKQYKDFLYEKQEWRGDESVTLDELWDSHSNRLRERSCMELSYAKVFQVEEVRYETGTAVVSNGEFVLEYSIGNLELVEGGDE